MVTRRVRPCIGWTVLFLFLGACRSPAPPPPPAPLSVPRFLREVAVESSAAPSEQPPYCWLQVRLHRVRAAPSTAKPMLSTAASLLRPEGTTPIPTPSPWIRGARVEFPSSDRLRFAGQPDWMQALCWEGVIALRPGNTLSLRLANEEVVDDGADFLAEFADRGPVQRKTQLDLRCGNDGTSSIEVSLICEDAAPLPSEQRPRASAVGPVIAVPRDQIRREAITLAPTLDAEQPRVVLWFPPPFQAITPDLLAWEVERWEFEPALDQGPRIQPVAVSETVENSHPEAATDAEHGDDLERAEVAMAASATGELDSRRSALAFLANRLEVALALDLVLLGDDVAGEALAAAAQQASFANASRAEQSWQLERAAWMVALDRVEPGEDAAPDVASVLLHRAGALGRFPTALRALVESVSSTEELSRRIAEENRRALEDSSPAIRVRAFDWLARRGSKVPGYDPLASREERRAALTALKESEQ